MSLARLHRSHMCHLGYTCFDLNLESALTYDCSPFAQVSPHYGRYAFTDIVPSYLAGVAAFLFTTLAIGILV
jgi:hypothetical protein